MVNYLRHIKHRRRNKYVCITLAAWFLVAVAFFSWLGVCQHEYRREFNGFVAKLEANITEATATFAGLRNAHDPAAASQALMRLSDNLKDLKQPLRPGIFGVPATQHRQAGLLARTLPDLRANLETTAQAVQYQQAVSLKLQLLSLRSAGNETQIRQLAELWQQTISETQAITVPAGLQDAHHALLQRMGAVQGIIVGLADLYKADDRAGFATKYTELGQAVEAFKGVATDLNAVSAQLDEQRAALLKAIHESL